MVLTCCCRVAIMARSYSSLEIGVGEGSSCCCCWWDIHDGNNDDDNDGDDDSS